MAAVPFSQARQNRILAQLSEPVLRKLLRAMELHAAPLRLSLYERNQPIEHVHFMLKGVASLVSRDESGNTVEVATVGNEGMVGLPVVLGSDRSTLDAFIQVPGEVLRLNAAELVRHLANDRSLTQVLQRYTQALLTQIAQSSVCNRKHSVGERCARWLLMTHDRVEEDRLLLTQEFLGQMLGVRRASVTAAASELQRAGLIGYTRGAITVLDRKGLEEASCECYAIVEREYDRLLGGSALARARASRGKRARTA